MPIIKRIIYRQSTKAAVFIDAANVIYSQRTLKWQIDFKKLMDYFKNNYQLDHVYFYFGYLKDDKKRAPENNPSEALYKREYFTKIGT